MIKGDEERAECIMWSHLENKTMPLQDQGHATCRTNDECSGFSCEGTFKDSPVMFGMRVLHCQEPPGLELFGHAPQFNANNFSHVFKHGSRQGSMIQLMGWYIALMQCVRLPLCLRHRNL